MNPLDQIAPPVQTTSRIGRPSWVVHLLGKFNARVGNASLETLPGRRTKELLGYLLLFRHQPHHREVLAGTLWSESSTAQSRHYLRQGLWNLRTLDGKGPGMSPLVHVQADWVQVVRQSLWLDVAELEEAFGPVKLLPGEQVDAEQAARLERVVALYRGDLLEGCYQDWCVFERERLRTMYIALLEKLLGYCETHGQPEEGLAYGEKLLRLDRAHERAHWRVMRLHYLAGNRTGALRQFERCRETLEEELGVAPGGRITDLYERIRADQGLDRPPPGAALAPPPASGGPASSGPPQQTGPRKGQPAGVPHQGTAPLRGALRALTLAEKLVERSIRAAQQDR